MLTLNIEVLLLSKGDFCDPLKPLLYHKNWETCSPDSGETPKKFRRNPEKLRSCPQFSVRKIGVASGIFLRTAPQFCSLHWAGPGACKPHRAPRRGMQACFLAKHRKKKILTNVPFWGHSARSSIGRAPRKAQAINMLNGRASQPRDAPGATCARRVRSEFTG